MLSVRKCPKRCPNLSEVVRTLSPKCKMGFGQLRTPKTGFRTKKASETRMNTHLSEMSEMSEHFLPLLARENFFFTKNLY